MKETASQKSTERAFISLDEAAEEIGCTRRFIETRLNAGELKAFRPSRRLVRISRAELNRWVEKFSSATVSPR